MRRRDLRIFFVGFVVVVVLSILCFFWVVVFGMRSVIIIGDGCVGIGWLEVGRFSICVVLLLLVLLVVRL